MSKKEIEKYPEILCAEKGSFAHDTLVNRVPRIIDNVILQNPYGAQINDQLRKLMAESQTGTIQRFAVSNGEQGAWDLFIEDHIGKTWFDTRFYYMEAYLYRRIVEISGYFEGNDKQISDPFFRRKVGDISDQQDVLNEMAGWYMYTASKEDPIAVLNRLLLFSLWGNKSDLSLLTVPRDQEQTRMDDIFRSEHLLIDQRAAIIEHMTTGIHTVDIILDNAGVELLSDLLMADFLLQQGHCSRVRLHAKLHPTFVSDATIHDIGYLVHFLEDSDNRAAMDFSYSVDRFLQNGSLEVHVHPFWNYPLSFYELPADLSALLTAGDLIVFKGDANYRRLLGDRHVPVHEPTEKLVDYLPAPSLVLRTLKSEILTGVQKERVNELDKADPEWRWNGRYGTIQLL